MMIYVKYKDGTMGQVSGRELEPLISGKQIQGFLRSSGWVDIDRGPVRRRSSPVPIVCEPAPQKQTVLQ